MCSPRVLTKSSGSTLQTCRRLCRLPARQCATMPFLEKALQEAIEALQDLQQALQQMYLQGACFSDVDMTRMYFVAEDAFSLDRIANTGRPTNVTCEDFAWLFGKMLPQLKKTLWPKAGFTMVPNKRKWPHVEGMVTYYKFWRQKVHKHLRQTHSWCPAPYELFF